MILHRSENGFGLRRLDRVKAILKMCQDRSPWSGGFIVPRVLGFGAHWAFVAVEMCSKSSESRIGLSAMVSE